ncbi:hypothetical protein EVAR_76150_1 [Eumeta japonica]|uniref:Uncharacterized protein n=1 Tax=Eumeta variegata TaxID=151549 RepID=A0A4C1UX76_EUMVA|nr:hypothetical protein EVAR_76150_1 [Eumeta japonica]
MRSHYVRPSVPHANLTDDLRAGRTSTATTEDNFSVIRLMTMADTDQLADLDALRHRYEATIAGWHTRLLVIVSDATRSKGAGSRCPGPPPLAGVKFENCFE